MRSIYIFMTRSKTVLSRFIYLVSLDKYTHVSISFDSDLENLYTSSRKNGITAFPAGPCREGLNKGYIGRHRGIPCGLYELEVTDEVFETAKAYADRIMADSDRYHYNLIGVLLCKLGIVYHRRNHYFCSELVSEILTVSGAWEPEKDTALIHPVELREIPGVRVLYEGTVGGLLTYMNEKPAEALA